MEQVLEKVFLPNVFQAEALRALEETSEKGGIVIMPTGTGKTFLASLWFKRILDLDPSAKLLFVCHNRDILSQANEKEFQGCLRHLNIDFGYYTAELKEFKQCTFATTQTLTRSLSEFKEDYFDYIIVDEAHHYQARSFKKVLEHFKPKFTLGLTATPHRMDKKDVFKVIGKKIYEAKTCDAIKKGLLCKINYWSTDNDIDFSGVAWSGSNYNEKDLNRTICVKEYDDVILKEYNETLREKFQKKKTICFCATVEHTHRMADLFNENGIKAVGLTSKNKEGTRNIWRNERVNIINGFKDGDYDIIFVRDLFNEGIDIPSCDSIMMLRPTQSHTIFTQQIGRGLRTAEGKEDVLILDFTGNCRNCTINYDVIAEMMNYNINDHIREEIIEFESSEKIKKVREKKAENEVVILSNGCRVRLSRRKVDILKVRLDSLPMTLDMAIEKYKEIYKTKPSIRKLYEENQRIYCHFKRHNLLDKYCLPSKRLRYRNREETIEEYEKIYTGKDKPTIDELIKKMGQSAYRTMLKEKNPHKYYRGNKVNFDRKLKDINSAIKKYHKIYKTKPTRGRLRKENESISRKFRENNLLDKYCQPNTFINLKQARKKYHKIYKTKPSIIKLSKQNYQIYYRLKKHNLIDKYCKREVCKKINLKQAIKEYNKIFKEKPTRTTLANHGGGIYQCFKRNNLIDKYCLSKSCGGGRMGVVLVTKKKLMSELKEFHNKFNRNPSLVEFVKEYNHGKITVRERLGEDIEKFISFKVNIKNKIKRTCKECGNEFYGRRGGKYCSKKCFYKTKIIYHRSKTYIEKRELIKKQVLEELDKRIKALGRLPTCREFKKSDNIKSLFGITYNELIENAYKNKYHKKGEHEKEEYFKEYKKIKNKQKKPLTFGRFFKESKFKRGKIDSTFGGFSIFKKAAEEYLSTKQQPNIKITPTYKPITIIEKKKRNISGTPAVYSKDLVRKEYKSKEDKVDIREKILSNIQDGDKVLLLESPDLSAIKEIEKQNKKPSKIVIPNDKEFKKLAENIRNYKTDLNIEIINTSVLQYLVDTKEKFDFVWLDYCGAFSYYIEDLDVLFQKHFNDMKLILTYNLFDPAKDDDSYYFTRVIDYVLSKVSETNKIRLINDITYRYKKTMYNIGFEVGCKRV